MGHHECIDFLLKMGAEKDAKSSQGSTALMDASSKGNHECVDLLLKAGAATDTQDSIEWTALVHTSAAGHHVR